MCLDYLRLQALTSEFNGRVWAAYQTFLVGRAEGLEVSLLEESVSRRHARVAATPAGWMIYDLDSTNGTYVNEEPVPGAGLRLKLGDRLRFGLVSLLVIELEELALDDEHRASIHLPGRQGPHLPPELEPAHRQPVDQSSDVFEWDAV